MAEKLVTIANFSKGLDPASQAELARIKLEAHGIPCFLAGKNFSAAYWLASIADSGINLQVKQSNAKRALEILAEHQKVYIEETEHNDPTPKSSEPACPKCASEDIEYEKFSTKLFFLSLLLLRFPLPLLKKSYKCNNCGHIWK